MSKRGDILEAAELAFERRGVRAVSVDEVIGAAGVSPRTLYSHFPSKTALTVAVLESRHARFLTAVRERMKAAPGAPVRAMFDALEDWFETTHASGCLSLRALGEYGTGPVQDEVKRYKRAIRDLARVAVAEQGADRAMADAVLALLEGAIALAPSIGAKPAIEAARGAATKLLDAEEH